MWTDIAGTSVEQCEGRYKEMLERAKRERGSHEIFQAEFIMADCSKVQYLIRGVWKKCRQFKSVSTQKHLGVCALADFLHILNLLLYVYVY